MKPFACSDRSEKLSKKARLLLVKTGKGHQLENHKAIKMLYRNDYVMVRDHPPLSEEGK